MPEVQKDEKTEEPTERRLTKTREKGRVAKSMEVNTVVILLTSLLFFYFYGGHFIHNILTFWREIFGNVAQFQVTPESLHYLLAIVLDQIFTILAPALFTLAFMGVVSNVWQNDGWIFSWSPLELKFEKINPLTGWKKFLGVEGLMNLIKSVGKIALVGTVVYLSLVDEWEKSPQFMMLPIWQTIILFGNETFSLVLKVLAVLMVIALIDFIYQKYQYIENQKMTKQEVRDERKDIDGNPIVKQRIKQKQFEIFRSRMMSAIPEAEVIITNPTHLSIALRYQRFKDPAPVCVGKGSGMMALKIREIAKEHDIPVLENKVLAQTLFKTVNVGDYVPETLYKAVAEVLAYIYRLKMKAL